MAYACSPAFLGGLGLGFGAWRFGIGSPPKCFLGYMRMTGMKD